MMNSTPNMGTLLRCLLEGTVSTPELQCASALCQQVSVVFSGLAPFMELTHINKSCRTGAEYAIKIHTADITGLQSGA